MPTVKNDQDEKDQSQLPPPPAVSELLSAGVGPVKEEAKDAIDDDQKSDSDDTDIFSEIAENPKPTQVSILEPVDHAKALEESIEGISRRIQLQAKFHYQLLLRDMD